MVLIKNVFKIKKEDKDSKLLQIEAIKVINKRKKAIDYINGVLANKELFNKDELIKIIKNIKSKLELK